MRCHPAFMAFDAPRTPKVGEYAFEVLAPTAVEEDFEAVVESVGRLSGFMGGDWPKGLTLEDNTVDLCWHAKEFDLNRSFAWIVRDRQGAYQGCVYIFPDFGRDAAFVPLWVRSSCEPEAQEPALKAVVSEWLHGPDWPDIDYRLCAPSDGPQPA